MGADAFKKTSGRSALELMLGANGRKIKIVEKFDDSFKALSEFTNKEDN